TVNCKSVATPHIKISIEIKYVICCESKFKPVPINKGTATAPAYIANKCCNPKTAAFPFGVSVCCCVFNCFVSKIMHPPLKTSPFLHLMKRYVLKRLHLSPCLLITDDHLGMIFQLRYQFLQPLHQPVGIILPIL